MVMNAGFSLVLGRLFSILCFLDRFRHSVAIAYTYMSDLSFCFHCIIVDNDLQFNNTRV